MIVSRGYRLRPIEAVHTWLETPEIADSPVFRPVLKVLSSAAEAGASVFKMTEASPRRSLDVLRGYVRRADLFREQSPVRLEWK